MVALVPVVIAVGLTTPAHAAETPTEDTTATTKATTTTDETTTTDAPTAPTEPADPVDPPAEETLKSGDPGTEELDGKPGVCDEDGCGRLEPIVECSFKDPGTGLYNTVWSYRGGRIPVRIPPGWFNFYFPGGVDRGQPTDFTPGLHRNVVITTHRGPLTWVLGLRKATAPGKDCGHNPVPITGAGLSSIVTLLAVGAGLGVVFLALGRRRRRARADYEAGAR